jgi:RNA polymerase sigma-70 factor (ECF subfamily)
MAIFHRSHSPAGGSQSDITDDAWADASAETRAIAGTGVAATGAVPHAGGDGSVGLSATDLLPEVLVPERERSRERRLVEAAVRGEESAIEALYRTHYDAIYRYVLLRLGSPSAAEDVTSQVFLGMVRGLGRYQDQGKPFVAWLYGIAQKQIAFHQRGQSRAPSPVDLDAAAELAAQSAGPHATAEQREMRVAIARALGQVPDGQREVIMLRYILSLSLAETAAIVGRTEGAVKQLQLRGLSTLKGILGREGVGLL